MPWSQADGGGGYGGAQTGPAQECVVVKRQLQAKEDVGRWCFVSNSTRLVRLERGVRDIDSYTTWQVGMLLPALCRSGGSMGGADWIRV